MTAMASILCSLISRKNDFCCLCLETCNEPIRIDDEVALNINNVPENATVAEILASVLGEDIFSHAKMFNAICEECAKSIISSYTFTESVIKNVEYLNNIIEGLSNSFESTAGNIEDSKTLFVSINLDDFTSKQLFDNKHQVTSTQAALKRFHSIDINQSKKEQLYPVQIKQDITKSSYNTVLTSKKSRIAIGIPTNDMLYDVNDKTLPKCKECFKIYPSIWSLRNHYIRVHAPKAFKCSKCPRSYGSAAFLRAHNVESHCTLVCSECGKTFYNRHTLKIHEAGHHLRLVCQSCGRVYKNRATFKNHIDLNVCQQKTRAHPSEAKYTCDYCNKKYTQKVSLRVHIQYDHGNYKAHVCDWCGKKFWAQSRLKAHVVKHTQEKNFICTLCGGKFVTKESLLYHTRTHTGEKPYPCPHCDSRFLSASRRADHVKRHHTGATLECDICHSKFTSHTFLHKHKKSHLSSDEKMKRTYGRLESTYIGYVTKEICIKNQIAASKPFENDWAVKEEKEIINQSFTNENIEVNDVDRVQYTHDADNVNKPSPEDGKVYLEVCEDGEDYTFKISKIEA